MFGNYAEKTTEGGFFFRNPDNRGAVFSGDGGETRLVDDVTRFAGHIACDGASRSELAVPIFLAGHLLGVFDLDSPLVARFDDDDRNGVQNLVSAYQDSLQT